jgi:hypothetical protein
MIADSYRSMVPFEAHIRKSKNDEFVGLRDSVRGGLWQGGRELAAFGAREGLLPWHTHPKALGHVTSPDCLHTSWMGKAADSQAVSAKKPDAFSSEP